MGRPETIVQCSFCGKAQRDVVKVVAGPGVYICNECIGLCNEIIAEEQEGAVQARAGSEGEGQGPTPTARRAGDPFLGIEGRLDRLTQAVEGLTAAILGVMMPRAASTVHDPEGDDEAPVA